MFTEWFETNIIFQNARDLTYLELPTKWKWDESKEIVERKKNV